MTIQEAIKTGREFRREGWQWWYRYEGETLEPRIICGEIVHFKLWICDIIATDWEVKND